MRYSRFPVPHALLVDVADTMDRFGRLRLEASPVHGLVLHALDRAVLEEVVRSKKISPMLGARIDDDTITSTPPNVAGSSRRCYASAGRPRISRATSTARRTPSRCAKKAGRCGPTSARRSRASGPAVPA